MKVPAIFLTLLVFMLLLPTYVFGAAADKPIKLYMNEKLLSPEVSPRIVNGNTIVPVRIIAEEIGAKVGWNEKARKVTVDKGNMNIQLTIDSKEATVQGVRTPMEVSPVIVDGNTMLPLRFVGEQFGVKFNWDGLTQSVHMFKQQDEDAVPVTAPVEMDDDDQNVSDSDEIVNPSPVTSKPQEGTTVPVTEVKNPPASQEGASNPSADQPEQTDPNVHLVQSIKLTDKELTVTAKDGEIKPNVMRLSNPNRIVFDFPNTTLGDSLKKLVVNNVGELPSENLLVEKIRFSNFSDNPATIRVILDLKSTADYRIEDSKQPNEFVAAIGEHQLRVVIDAGHGDTDPGALSITGKHEKDFTLAMAKKVTEKLSQDKNIDVLMTRSDDTFVELDDRVSFANNNQADLFLSIHGNKFSKESVSGTETYYYERPESLDFAKIVHKHVVEAAGFPDRGVREADYRVIHKTTMPAVLVEVGYLSNPNDEAAMYSETFQDQVAASLVAAIKEYLNIK